MQKQTETQAVWKSYWGERQKSLQNPLGKRRAVTAAFQLLERAAKEPARPARIIELGCGEGHILGELLKMCEANGIAVEECVGIDYQAHAIENARRLYPRMNFLLADYARQPLSLQPFDLALLVGTLHEVYSASRSAEKGEIDQSLGERAVEKALRCGARLVGDGKYLVLFDGVEHASPDLKITIRFRSACALDEFKKMVGEYEAFRLSYEAETDDRVKISMRDFTRYITKLRFFNTDLWEIERRESYQYFSESEFAGHLGELGINILELQCSSPSLNDWRDRVSIETPGVDFPKENILIVGQKAETRRAFSVAG